MNNLEPCPFCGKPPEKWTYHEESHKWRPYISCTNDDCLVEAEVADIQRVGKESDIDWTVLESAWNTRYDENS